MSREGIKVRFKLPLRQTTGMVASLLRMANLDWAVPDYPTLCRRQKALAVQIPYRRGDGPLNLLVDSTGIKFLGDGALSWFVCKPLPGSKWQARKHGIQGRRQSLPGNGWRLRHPPLPHGHYRPPGHADHPHPQERATVERGLPAAIARNETLRAARHYGRAFWKRWAGYQARSRIEAKMRCLKAFGVRIAARDPDRQTAEIQIRIALINRFNALGTAEIVRVA